MYNKCCWLKNFYQEGTYIWDNENIRNKRIGDGLATISYLYDCCNKFCGVKIVAEGSFPTLSSQKITITTTFYCNGKFTQTDTWGSSICGNWKKYCNSIYTYASGTLYNTPTTPENICLKLHTFKSSLTPLNYRNSAYTKINCTYTYAGETNFTKFII